MAPRFKRAIADGRSPERVWAHYETEKRLADELRASSRSERGKIYSHMYRELFAEIPDHPRLVRREDPATTKIANKHKLRLLSKFADGGSVLGEFGAGDCRFAIEVAKHVHRVYAIDIADQAGGAADRVENLEQVIYDGCDLPIEDETLDIMISDQLLEHLHPEDVNLHFEMVRRVLKPGGVYVIRTPHALTGPHDISKYFSEVAEGFHLKEWTYVELIPELRAAGFSSTVPFRTWRQHMVHPPLSYLTAAERIVRRLPYRARVRVAHYLLKEVCIAAYR
jgi:SAM-dependent methyltransferase